MATECEFWGALLLWRTEKPESASSEGRSGGRPQGVTVAVGVTQPQRPLLGGSPWGHGLGVCLGAPPGGGPAGEHRRGGQKGQKGRGQAPDSGPSPQRPGLVLPALQVSSSEPPPARTYTDLQNGDPALTAAPSRGRESRVPEPRGHPKPAQTHTSLTRTHLRLFTKRKGPSVSNQSPVPNSDSPRSPQSRFAGLSPA